MKTQETSSTHYLEQLTWTSEGLLPAIAQDASSGKILMMAWMNKESLRLTNEEGIAIYWSRSRQKLWRKGETSGHVQRVQSIQLDCDSDVIILHVEQIGGIACHTGRESCFYRTLVDNSWQDNVNEPVLKDPKDIYS